MASVWLLFFKIVFSYHRRDVVSFSVPRNQDPRVASSSLFSLLLQASLDLDLTAERTRVRCSRQWAQVGKQTIVREVNVRMGVEASERSAHEVFEVLEVPNVKVGPL